MTVHSHVFETDDDETERSVWKPRATKPAKQWLDEMRRDYQLPTTEKSKQ